MECKLNIHGFSVNKMYEYDIKTGKQHRSKLYNKWRLKALQEMQGLPTLEEMGVDPNKPMRLTAVFTHVRGYDVDNMIKSFQDILTEYYGIEDDNNFVEPIPKRGTSFARTINDGSITFTIENCEGLIMNEFDKLLMAIDKGWIVF